MTLNTNNAIVEDVFEVVKKFNPHCVILQECKLNISCGRYNKFIFENMTLLWDDNALKIHGYEGKKHKGNLYMVANFSLVENSEIKFVFYGVYGNRKLGLDIDYLDLKDNDPWIMMGDFSSTLPGEGSYSCPNQKPRVCELIALRERDGVTDIEYSNIKFTFADDNEIPRRLSQPDRVIYNKPFGNYFSSIYAEVIGSCVSSHRPVLTVLDYQ